MAANQDIDPDELPPLVVTSFDQLNFLLIDDNDSSLDLMEAMLQSVSVGSIRRAKSVFTGVGLLADPRTKIDCIICDHYMDGMTGLALLQRIRAGRNEIVPRDMRFILTTGDTGEELVRTALKLDVNGFIIKPISITAVVKTLHLVFGRQLRLKAAADYIKVALPQQA